MTPEQRQFAYSIASALNDLHSLTLHESYVRKYPRKVLEETLRTVLAVPEHKILKSRGAYYNSLIQRNASKYHRH